MELICQHLVGADLLQLSEVSRGWNKVISKSEKEMKKIQLMIDEDSKREFDMDVIRFSERKYAHVAVRKLFRSRDHIFQLLNKLQGSLETIDTCFDIDMGELHLPHVKSLAIRTNRCFPRGLLTSVSTLTKLHLAGSIENPVIVVLCLTSNLQLKELILEQKAPTSLFQHINASPEFQLTTFKCDKASFPEQVERNFLAFLSRHVNTLEVLKLLQCSEKLMESIVNAMPKLRTVTFGGISHNEIPFLRLNEHPALEELNLIMVRTSTMKYLVEAAPKLKKVYTAGLSQNFLHFLADCVPTLRQLQYAYPAKGEDEGFTTEDFLDSYNYFIEDFADVNGDIEIEQI